MTILCCANRSLMLLWSHTTVIFFRVCCVSTHIWQHVILPPSIPSITVKSEHTPVEKPDFSYRMQTKWTADIFYEADDPSQPFQSRYRKQALKQSKCRWRHIEDRCRWQKKQQHFDKIIYFSLAWGWPITLTYTTTPLFLMHDLWHIPWTHVIRKLPLSSGHIVDCLILNIIHLWCVRLMERSRMFHRKHDLHKRLSIIHVSKTGTWPRKPCWLLIRTEGVYVTL